MLLQQTTIKLRGKYLGIRVAGPLDDKVILLWKRVSGEDDRNLVP